MCTKYPELFTALARSFEPRQVKTKTETSKKSGQSWSCSYITARTVMNRLDDVLGPENWWDTYCPAGENSVACTLTIRLPDGSTVTKCDAGGNAGMADSGDDDKSGYSDAFKRAAVKFGVGRYLYGEGVMQYNGPRAESATPAPPAKATGKWGNGQPVGAEPAPTTPREKKAPTSGKGFFAWVREKEEQHQVALLKYLNGWGKLQEYPARIVDWDAGQVAQGFEAACRKLSNLEPENASQEVEAN